MTMKQISPALMAVLVAQAPTVGPDGKVRGPKKKSPQDRARRDAKNRQKQARRRSRGS